MNKLLGLVGFVVCARAALWVLRVPATLPIRDGVGGLALILMGNAFDTFMRKLTVKQPRRPLRVVLL